jgi:flagellar biosynthesis protein FliQ
MDDAICTKLTLQKSTAAQKLVLYFSLLFGFFLSLIVKYMAAITRILDETLNQNPRFISLDVNTKLKMSRSKLAMSRIKGKVFFFIS